MKKVHRFLVTAVPDESPFTIDDPEIVHLATHVLKLKIGEHCRVFTSSSDDTLATITSIQKDSLTLEKKESIPALSVPKQLSAFVAITKRDTFEFVVQKLTELGIARISPIITDRTIKQSLRIDRLQKISDEALEQSGLSTRVRIDAPQTLSEALMSQDPKTVIYCERGATHHTPPATTGPLVLLVGPEGGWSDAEHAFFVEKKYYDFHLCEPTLRAETAAIVAAHTILWM